LGALFLIISLLVLIALSVPVAIALALSSMFYLVFIENAPILVAIQRIVVAADSFTLLALPLFIISGNIMTQGGLSKRLISFVDDLIGWVTGGLAIVTTVACLFFSAISGSVTATTAAIGSIMIPGMQDKGYDRDFGAAVTATSGILGAVTPPSLMMISYGTITGVSIGGLFLGGIIPGIICAIGLICVSYLICRKKGYVSERKRPPFSKLFASFRSAIMALFMPVIVLGGIYGGLFTPTEAAAVAVVYCYIVASLIYRDISLKDIPRILLMSIRTSSNIMLLVCAASLFGWALAIGRIPDVVARAVLGITENPILVLLLVNLLLLLVGAFLESIASIVIMTPVLFPIITYLGVDPLHFGIIMTLNIAIGTVTPPFGVSLFVASGISGVPIEKIIKATLPYLASLLIVLLLTSYIPGIATLLPNL